MTNDFDRIIERRHTDSSKWNRYGDDVLPLWVADMDFASPKPILKALHLRVEQGIFGYGEEPRALREIVAERMQRLYHWRINPDSVVFLPGLVSGLNVVSRAVGSYGSSVLVNTPVYPPFLTAPLNQGIAVHAAPLAAKCRSLHGVDVLSFELDIDALEYALAPDTSFFMLCSPHNPIGRAWNRTELESLAEFCLRHNLVVCSDEIHSDLLLDGTRHIPIASLSAEIEYRSVTLLAPSKTFNIPGLGCSMAIVPDGGLRARLLQASAGIVPHVNVLGYVAAHAAYTECDDWLADLRRYLTDNRDFVVDYISRFMPSLRVTVPEATYLVWIDCRQAGIEGNPFQFFLNHAKVALNDGAFFGDNGRGFVRLNFGCPRTTLLAALERMAAALSALG